MRQSRKETILKKATEKLRDSRIGRIRQAKCVMVFLMFLLSRFAIFNIYCENEKNAGMWIRMTVTRYTPMYQWTLLMVNISFCSSCFISSLLNRHFLGENLLFHLGMPCFYCCLLEFDSDGTRTPIVSRASSFEGEY